jgi:predicted N-formylglutamate amidohydrolase
MQDSVRMSGREPAFNTIANVERIVVTCEHAGNRVPVRYRHLFEKKTSILSTHRAWDPCALFVAKRIASFLNAPLFYCETTRLLIDANRSLRHRKVFSEFSKTLPDAEKEWLVHNVYRAYRDPAEQTIRTWIQSGKTVLHLSIHSFTPVLNGRERNTDIGLLYDPGREEEKNFSRFLQQELRRHTELRVRRNYPYLGYKDGFTTALRRNSPLHQYLGLEIEIGQSLQNRKNLVERLTGVFGLVIKSRLNSETGR